MDAEEFERIDSARALRAIGALLALWAFWRLIRAMAYQQGYDDGARQETLLRRAYVLGAEYPTKPTREGKRGPLTIVR